MPRNHGLETNRFGTSDKKSFINQDEIARLPIFLKRKRMGIVSMITRGMRNNFVRSGGDVLGIE